MYKMGKLKWMNLYSFACIAYIAYEEYRIQQKENKSLFITFKLFKMYYVIIIKIPYFFPCIFYLRVNLKKEW